MQSLPGAAGYLLCLPATQSVVWTVCWGDGGGRDTIPALYLGPRLHSLLCSLPLCDAREENVLLPGRGEPELCFRLIQ